MTCAWEAELQQHPNREFVTWLVDRIRCGFCIGCNYAVKIGVSAAKNMCLAYEHPQPIHVSWFGVIPKLHQPRNWSLITNPSSPHFCSVAAGCVSQKSRYTMVYGRIVKCQISYLCRN